MCKENLSFLVKYIKTLTFENSGFRHLISDSVVHQSNYKHLRFTIDRTSDMVIKASFSISYLT